MQYMPWVFFFAEKTVNCPQRLAQEHDLAIRANHEEVHALVQTHATEVGELVQEHDQALQFQAGRHTAVLEAKDEEMRVCVEAHEVAVQELERKGSQWT